MTVPFRHPWGASLRPATLLALMAALLLSSACVRASARTAARGPLQPTAPPAQGRTIPDSAVAVETGSVRSSDSIEDYLRTRELMVPVDGVRVADLRDNFASSRGNRGHNAHDIMAPRGTRILSADDGRIIRLSNNSLGGITIYATDPAERLVYYYAHLDRYAPGLKAGQEVRKGDLLGFVGSTGNASPAAPHLHFQVAQLLDMSRHWEGIPINAIPYFALAGGKR